MSHMVSSSDRSLAADADATMIFRLTSARSAKVGTGFVSDRAL